MKIIIPVLLSAVGGILIGSNSQLIAGSILILCNLYWAIKMCKNLTEASLEIE